MRGRKALRISQVGLRGVVGAGLTAGHVIDFASAFGTFVEPGRPVLIGRDPRASGRMIREGVIAGLLACGHEVVDLGIVFVSCDSTCDPAKGRGRRHLHNGKSQYCRVERREVLRTKRNLSLDGRSQ